MQRMKNLLLVLGGTLDALFLKECYEKIQDNENIEYAPIILCDEVPYWDIEKIDDFRRKNLIRDFVNLIEFHRMQRNMMIL